MPNETQGAFPDPSGTLVRGADGVFVLVTKDKGIQPITPDQLKAIKAILDGADYAVSEVLLGPLVNGGNLSGRCVNVSVTQLEL